MRLIEVDGKDYRYHVGKSFIVIQSDERGVNTVVELDEFTGLTWEQIEKQQLKKSFSIKPKQISEYIKDNRL